jgi:hypothetical protein
MTVNLRFQPNSLIDHRASPIRRVTLTGKLKNMDRRPVSVLSLMAQASLADRTELVVQTRGELRVFNPSLAPDQESVAQLMIDLPATVLKGIEDHRRNRDGTVALRLDIEGSAAPLVTIKDRNSQPLSDQVVGPVTSASVDVRDHAERPEFMIGRDVWLDLLKRVGYGETEVFEVSRFTLEGTDEHSRRMVERLQEAVAAARTGDPCGALAKSRQAFEGWGSGAGGNPKKGFEILLAAARPGDVQAPKREKLDALLSALADFQHLGRHDRPPFTPVDAADAELGVQVSLALANYLSKLLAAS